MFLDPYTFYHAYYPQYLFLRAITYILTYQAQKTRPPSPPPPSVANSQSSSSSAMRDSFHQCFYVTFSLLFVFSLDSLLKSVTVYLGLSYCVFAFVLVKF